MGHKCYIRNVKGVLLFQSQKLIAVNLATGMVADFDRLTGFMEAERPSTRRTENNDGSLSRSRAVGLTNWRGLGDEDHIFYSYSLGPAVRAPTN